MGSAATTSRVHDPFVGAVAFVIDRLEGGDRYTIDPDDPGGATKFGLSKRANPDLDIEHLTRDEAIRVYHERYWLQGRCDELPPPLALQFFSVFVNFPPRQAVKCLQRALGGVKVDGLMGPLTIAAANQFRPQAELRARMTRECIDYYIRLAEKRPVLRKYRHGWIGRACRVADEAGAWMA